MLAVEATVRTELGSVEAALYSLSVISAIAAAVPLLLGVLRIPIAEVVALLVAGVIFGPHVLGWIQLDSSILLLSEIGLGFLFFSAGFELETPSVRGRSGRLAVTGWLLSVAVSIAVALVLWKLGLIHDRAGLAIALTSTALGTLVPVLRDQNLLHTGFGRLFMGAGAIGEFGPVLAISLLLTMKGPVLGLVAVLLFAGVAFLIAVVPPHLNTQKITDLLEHGHRNSSQIAVRLTMLLLVTLLALASWFGLDIVMGAFAAGIIFKFYAESGHQQNDSRLHSKLMGLAFGIFIPIFFVSSGAMLDVHSLCSNPLLMVLFLVLLLLVRGVPQLLVYRHAIPDFAERARFSLYVATGLPIIVAVTSIGMINGIMRPEVAASLVGAGALSVLIFPLLADLLRPRTKH